MNTSGLSEKTDSVVRQVIDLAVATHGAKRGLHRVAELIGVTERWVRSFRFGESARVSAETYLRALEARQALADERAAQIRAELAELSQIARDRIHEGIQDSLGVGVAHTCGDPGVDPRQGRRGQQDAHGVGA